MFLIDRFSTAIWPTQIARTQTSGCWNAVNGIKFDSVVDGIALIIRQTFDGEHISQ